MFYQRVPLHFLSLTLLLSTPVFGEDSLTKLSSDVASMRQLLSSLQQVVAKQSARLAALEAENETLRKQISTPRALSPATELQAASSQPKRVLPEIGFVVDMVAASTESPEDSEGNDRLSVREVELGIGHDVDPYTRLDSTITFSDFEEVALEEAYATYRGIPGNFHLRLGRMRPRLERSSARHRDQLATVDEPLVIQRYLGIEGLYRTGIEISNFLPTPWSSPAHEVILGVMEGGIGEDGTLFSSSRRHPSFYARLRNSFDLSDAALFELSGSYLRGSADEDSNLEVNGLIIDAVGSYSFDAQRKLRLELESFFQRRSEGFTATDEPLSDFRHHPWGMYALADLRLSQEWAVGGRWDYVKPVNFSEEFSREADTAGSIYATFFQSEFARWRFQYQRINLAEEGHDDRLFLQGTFAIGTHKHPLE